MNRRSECHPARAHYAKGLCALCYRKKFFSSWVSPTFATCHPDRKVRSRGLCCPCYQRLRASPSFEPVGRKPTVNKCGHPDKPHDSHGMCKACRSKAWRAANPERDRHHRDVTRLNRYGITKAHFDHLMDEQGGKCAICLRAFRSRRATHIDHCHATTTVRGLLCNGCNRALGMFGDNEAGLLRALAYLRRGRKEEAA